MVAVALNAAARLRERVLNRLAAGCSRLLMLARYAAAHVRVLGAVFLAMLAMIAPSVALAQSGQCQAINNNQIAVGAGYSAPNTLSGTYNIGNQNFAGEQLSSTNYSDFNQGLAPGEIISYSWTRNSGTGYVQVTLQEQSGFTLRSGSIENSTAISGSGSITVGAANDVFSIAVTNYSIDQANGVSNAAEAGRNNTSVSFTISCLSAASTPTVTGISPTAGPTVGGTTVVINGSNFTGVTGAAGVRFGATNATNYVVNSNTQITATSPTNAAGTYNVRVTNGGNTSAASAADQFTYVSAPTVTAVSPTAGPTGGGTTVTITGTGFAAASPTGAVKFGATNATYTINSNTQITATAPANSAGTYDITVTTVGGTSATSAADQFTYVSAPTVSSISPTAGPTGGGTTVIISGTGFAAANPTGAVKFGATNATYTINSNTQITATSPANSAGTYDITVTTVGGTSATSAADQFTYVSAPTVTSISPTSGATTGGTSVTITGTNFSGATAVTFGGTASFNYTIMNGTQIVAIAPAGVAGTVDIRVTTIGGTSATSAADQFTYVLVPTASSFSYSPIIAYNTGADLTTSINVAMGGNVQNNPTSYAVGSATSAQGGTVTIDSSGMATYTPPRFYRNANDSFTFTATNAAGTSSSRTVTVTIGNPSFSVSLPAALGTVGAAYNPGGSPVTVSGGSAPYSNFSATGLPAGLSMNASGVISGTPTTATNATVVVTVTDNSIGAGPITTTASTGLTILVPTITLSPASGALPNAQAGMAYNQIVSSSGGYAPMSYSVSAGATPPGLTISTNGVLSGTPTATGTYNFTVTAQDSSSNAYTGQSTYSLTVTAPTITLNPVTIPGGVVNVAYSQTLTALGGTAPYTYARDSGTLPNGITLSSGGVLSGTPTDTGSFSFTVRAIDSTGGGTFSVIQAYVLTIGAGGQTISFTSTPPLATVPGPDYGVTAVASSGLGVSFSLDAVSTGCVLSGNTVSFTSTGTCVINADQAGDANWNPAPRVQQSFAVVASPPIAADLTGVAVAWNSPGTVIDLSGSISGGVHTSVAVLSGPAHGTASINGDVITYIPTAGYFGADSFTYTATGQGGTSNTATVSLVVATPAAPVASNLSGVAVPYASAGTAIDLSSSVSGVSTNLAIGTAPAHGTVSVSGSVVTYTPAAEYYGTDSFSFTATGPGGTSAPATVSLLVATPPAPVIEAPTGPVTTPSVPGGGSAPVSISLVERTEGVLEGYRVTVDARFGTVEIVTSTGTASALSTGSGSAAPSAAETFQLVYTPTSNFMGEDTVTLVAYGPGGDSAPVTFTFRVAGKAPDLSGQTASTGSVRLAPTATLIGGPFEGLRITRAPAFGTATVDGLSIVFTPGAANAGSTSLDYVVELGFGDSAVGRIDLVSNQAPGTQTLTAETVQGHPVTVRISDTLGGPFTGAAVTSVSPATAGTATISGANGVYDLTFTPEGLFAGEVEVGFTLTNATATTPGTLTVVVAARPDPSQDPEVRGVATSQVTTARRFADTQIDNFQRRLEALRSGNNSSSNGVSLNFGFAGGDDERDPRTALRRQLGQDRNLDPGQRNDDREREMLGLSIWQDRLLAEPSAKVADGRLDATPVSAAGHEEASGPALGVWTSGSVDWGRQDASGTRDSRFTTQGVTAGVDVKITDRLIVGAGLGYGEDKTRIGDNGSISRGKAVTGAAYASWRPTETWFLDGVVGLSDLDFDSRRWAAGLADQADGYVDGERTGEVRFIAASVGRSLRRPGLTTDLYARLESRDIQLDGFTETGGGISALDWDALDQRSLSINLGASWRWSIESRRLGLIAPSARIEWARELEDIGAQGVRYADWTFSPTYLVQLDDWSRNAANLDLGIEWSLSKRLMFSLGYRGMLGDASNSHGGQVGLKFNW